MEYSMSPAPVSSIKKMNTIARVRLDILVGRGYRAASRGISLARTLPHPPGWRALAQLARAGGASEMGPGL